jgi:hypothetical protein
MRPYYLDGDLAQHGLERSPRLLRDTAHALTLQGPVIPVIGRRLSMAADLWLLCSFQGPWRGDNAGRSLALMEAIFDRFTRAPGGRRSLKTQQHAGVVLRAWSVVLPK